MRTTHKQISPGGDRRSVTVTVGYGPGDLRLVVAPNIRAALDEAERRWGPWFTIESVSTPDTIYADLTGETARRWNHTKGEGNQTERDKIERALGRKLRPGELGVRRRQPDLKLASGSFPNAPQEDPANFTARRKTRHRWFNPRPWRDSFNG